MHDFFDIVGLSRSAPPVEVRRVCAHLIRRSHPDFHSVRSGLPRGDRGGAVMIPRRDVAVDFVDVAAVLDRIQSAFFRSSADAP